MHTLTCIALNLIIINNQARKKVKEDKGNKQGKKEGRNEEGRNKKGNKKEKKEGKNGLILDIFDRDGAGSIISLNKFFKKLSRSSE